MAKLGIRMRIYNKNTSADPDIWSPDMAYARQLMEKDGVTIVRSPAATSHSDFANMKEINLIEWNARYKNVLSYMQWRGVKFLRRVTKAYLHAVVEATPHDTGNAVRNWSVVDSKEGSVPAYVDMKGEPVDQAEAIDQALAAGDAVIDGLKRYSQPVVANSTPYIDLLDVGYSGQAPQGMTLYGEAAVQKEWDAFHAEGDGLLKKAEAARELGSRRKK